MAFDDKVGKKVKSFQEKKQESDDKSFKGYLLPQNAFVSEK